MNTPQAPKIMLLGDSGVGKTHSIRTLCDAGVEVFVVATEPGVLNVLGDIPSTKLHHNYLPPMPMSLDALASQIDKINTSSYKFLTEMVGSRTEFRQMLDFVTLLKNYKCQRDGKEYGDVMKWDSSRALVVDSLSGLAMMMVNATIGTKPMMNQPEYGLAMTALERTINSLAMNTNCWFVLTAHIEREFDEITGGATLMASAIGKKLAPKLPRFFDEVVLARREGADFRWSTIASGVSTKTRLLGLSEKLEPSFVPLYKAWKAKTSTQ